MRAESKPPPKWISSSWPSESLCAIVVRREGRAYHRLELENWVRYQPGKRESRVGLIGCDSETG
jgi:hypothetical protein